MNSVIRIATALAALSSAPAAFSAPDLVGRLVDQVSVEEGRISYSVVVTNQGTSAAVGLNRIKGILIPTIDLAAEPTREGVVLPFSDLQIDLAPGASITQEVSVELPRVIRGRYLLGAIVNSNSAINEGSNNIANNHTEDLIATRTIERDVAIPAVGGTDFYQEIDGDVLPSGRGSIMHVSRTILRGAQNNVRASDVWARFMVANIEAKKLWTAPYGSGVEKQWGTLAWQSERDANGHPIVIDYYTNSNTIDHIPAGRHMFLTLLNSRDLFEEIDTSNNLDLEPLELAAVRLTDNQGGPVSVLNLSVVQGQNLGARTYNLARVFSAAVNVAITSTESVAWMSLPTAEVALSSNARINIDFQTASLEAGEYSTVLKLELVGTATVVEIPVQLTVLATDVAQRAVADVATSLAFTTEQEIRPAANMLVVRNTGSLPLTITLQPLTSWIQTGVTELTIAPGASESISVSVLPHSMRAPSNYTGVLRLHTNTERAQVDVSVSMNITARTTNLPQPTP